MKKLLLVALLATASITTFTSCSKEETSTPAATDIRDQSIGNYTYAQTAYTMNNGTLEVLGSAGTGTFTLEKGSSNTILVNENGSTAFTAAKIATANNGFTFDVSTSSQGGYDIQGYGGYTLGSVKYHGAYFSSTKVFGFYYSATKDGKTNYFQVEATKK